MRMRLTTLVAFFAVLALLVAPVSFAFAASFQGKPPCHQSASDDAKSSQTCCTILCCAAVVPVLDAAFYGLDIEIVAVSNASVIKGAVPPPLLGPPRFIA